MVSLIKIEFWLKKHLKTIMNIIKKIPQIFNFHDNLTKCCCCASVWTKEEGKLKHK